jgi:acyl carrier protein
MAEPSGKGDNILCAYIVSGNHKELDVTGLKDHLSRQLPGYMVPSIFKKVERIPLTVNGKVDRRALRAAGTQLGPGARVQYAAPGTAAETKIAGIWQEVLKWNGDEIGIHDNFFDIGGTSMDVIRVNGKITKELGKEIPIIAMYKYTTIHSLSQFIEQTKTGETGEQDIHYESEREIKIQRGRSDKNKIREMRRKGR